MAAYGGSFESANSIKSRKEAKREERELVLQQEHTVKNKKKKKEKKAKKSKKEKKKKAKKETKDEEDASCDNSEDSEDEWVDAPAPSGGGDKAWKVEHDATPTVSSASANRRDEWMTFDFLAMKTTSQAERRAQKEAEKEAERQKAESIEQAGLLRLELNPYWKDGGSGLPQEDTSSTAVKKAGVVNDGGVSWLRKSYQRMKEQADREQRSLESVVAERYGVNTHTHTHSSVITNDSLEMSSSQGNLFILYKFLNLFYTSVNVTYAKTDWVCQSTSSESEEEEEEEVILTDEEMNKLGAKLVKAELMGNTALVENLKAQMQAARRAKENRAQRKAQNKPVSAATDSEKDVVLFRTDPMGRAWPVKAPSQPQEPRGGRRKRKAIETHQDGERVRYFKDDDGMDLQEMVRREKMSSAEDQNALYSRMAAKMMGRTDGDNYTLDDMFVSSAAQRERSDRDEERQRNKAVQETRRLAGQMEKCRHCFDSPELPKHLIAAVGNKVYLCLPNSVSLTEGHCLIVPIQHHTAATGLDEDIWSEIQMFRRALVRMFESQELDCVFLETHMNPKRHLHMVYECVPLPRELGDMAPIYFKKAIMESDEEWAMNKKVVDLSSRDIRQAVPRGLPYFSVDFGLQGGFAHVIENEQKFPHYFGKEILGGMLDLEPRRWRKPIRENFDDQRKKVLKLAQWWKAFDCTKTDS
uniref:CWF19-like protein 2 n=1 Tax=Sinocyclocheilus grahami TaxID=75366 RepID=A0A672MQW1_SINGR